MDANRMPTMNEARRRGLTMLLGRHQADDLLAFRLAQRLSAAAPQRRDRAA